MKPATENPFIIQQNHVNTLQVFIYFIVLIVSPIFIIYRILGFILILLVFDITGRILMLTLPKYPEPYTKQQYKRVKRFFKAFGIACSFIQNLVTIRKGDIDKENAKILVANHTTLNDAVVNCLLLPTRMVAKSNLINFPVFKTFLTLQRAILVERPDCHLSQKNKFLKPEGKTSTQIISERLKDPLTQITLCPEGTIAAPGIIMRFHTSAFIQGYPVIPVCIKYYTLLPTAWTTHHWLFVLFNSLANPFGLCIVKVLKPQTRQEGETPQQFADRVGQMMADELKYKYVPYQSQDWFYFSGKSKNGTKEYIEDFSWMGTLDEFCKKYKIFRWLGIKSYQIKKIKCPE